jgi:hypothetical protein
MGYFMDCFRLRQGFGGEVAMTAAIFDHAFAIPRHKAACCRSRHSEPQRDGFVSCFTARLAESRHGQIMRCWRDFSQRRFLPKLHPVPSGGVFFLSGPSTVPSRGGLRRRQSVLACFAL